MPDVDLKLQLPERQRQPRLHVRLHERRQRLELPALNVDLQDVDVRVPVHPHQTVERVHLILVLGAVLVLAGETVGEEVGARSEGLGDLGPEGVDGEVVAPDLAVLCAGEQLGLEGRLVVDAWTHVSALTWRGF